jgi:hypothetical protein
MSFFIPKKKPSRLLGTFVVEWLICIPRTLFIETSNQRTYYWIPICWQRLQILEFPSCGTQQPSETCWNDCLDGPKRFTKEIPFQHMENANQIVQAVLAGERPKIPEHAPEALIQIITQC